MRNNPRPPVTDIPFIQSNLEPRRMDHRKFNTRSSNTNLSDMSLYGLNYGERTRSGGGTCYFCGHERHSSEGTKISWREKCPARNSICRDCKEIGHYTGMIACRLKRHDNVIIIKQN